MILDEILSHKRGEVRLKRAAKPLEQVLPRLETARPPRDFHGRFAGEQIAVIAEIKPRSPTKGIFPAALKPEELARDYQQGGAAALSVLGDEKYFGGGPELVARIASDHVSAIPVMYKDFIVDPYQVYEARAGSADAVLLIVRAVRPHELEELLRLTHELGMAALVETFTVGEARIALDCGARIVGINNRDLQTFKVDLSISERIANELPKGIVRISESGISTRADMRRMELAGFHGVLVGEALLASSNPAAQLAELLRP